ncbi:hypothetical protein [Streptomyces sp. SID14515]|uniref:hypothetical protein n=1 Tax=Streptomyces sp. SID14515 TaxID=2706074 RepID=UPI0013C8FF3D|nr:hypothetical protein [Streptomyces sp. SID14515]NEB36447.1 hypothetical protein [Streptomyces sp. SID14515]
MRIADFHKEVWPPSFGTAAGNVKDSVALNRYADIEGITKYLLSGHELFSVMGSSEDVLGTGETILGGDSIHSDGEWVWRGDLCFYVRKHHVQLPEEFLERMRGKGYVMPPENDIELRKIAQRIHDGLTAA